MASAPGIRVPIFRPTLPPLSEFDQAVRKIWKSRMLSNFAAFAQELEAASMAYIGCSYVRAISSCDTGLIAVLRALDLPKNGEVILPSFTFNSTANAVAWNNLRPRFADVDPGTFCLDPLATSDEVNSKTVAILATHTFGCPAAVKGLEEVADDAGVPLLFDAAHGLGSLVGKKKVGNFGTAEIFSLSGTKVVTSGEGGLVATDDRRLVRKIELIRAYGFRGDYNTKILGMNGKISELNAALGCLNLRRVEQNVSRRQALVKRYIRGLGKGLPLQIQHIPRGNRSTYKDFALVIPAKRRSVQDALSRRGIQTKTYFRPLHTSAYFRAARRGPLRVTERLSREVLCVPLWNDLPPNVQDEVVTTIRGAL